MDTNAPQASDPNSTPAPTAVTSDPLWYKDAIIYQLHVKAFFDSNQDGVGDFHGLTEKLDYIRDLGVNTIWLLPFYPSPMLDDGYDVADYENINPAFGNRQDFRHFVREAHRRGLRIITELMGQRRAVALLAPVLQSPAGSQLRQSAGAESGPAHHAFLARSRGRRIPARRDSLPG
jgi:maltose alpha-D-glucosyltransferase/alpha-amylase